MNKRVVKIEETVESHSENGLKTFLPIFSQYFPLTLAFTLWKHCRMQTTFTPMHENL